ncbi:MAG: 3-hydroxybutyryl-CoA dehydrogenase, partial [Phaeodactylibacter sp.]|nr:3-hydroxybutyryl-CoA dehydrogenase [Phaeodactylibacter sp.]
MKKVAVIGAGTMGNGIAHVFAMHDYTVALVDISEPALEKALHTIDKNLARMVSKEKIDEARKASTLQNITTSTDMAAALSDVDLVVEAATENVALKLNIFRQMDAAAPAHAILATNTSSISITQIAAVTQRPEQVIGMHFM